MKTASAPLTQTETPAPPDGLVCTRCGGYTFERLQRTGFFQRRILPFFNRYPWRCVFCNKLTYRRARNNAELHLVAQKLSLRRQHITP